MTTDRRTVPSLITVLLTAVAALPVFAGRGNADNPGVLPPQAAAYGQTYGEWSARWWQWAVSFPEELNPVIDETGENCGVGQSGPVWFLAGTFGQTAERTCSVPSGKALLIPIVNAFWLAPADVEFAVWLADDVLGLDSSSLTDGELMRLAAQWQIDHSHDLSCTIDGEPVRNLGMYRTQSPEFSATLSELFEDFGYEATTYTPCVSDGYWVLLAPLPPGEHLIRFTAQNTFSVAEGDPFDDSWSLSVTYHLTVTSGNQ